MKYLQLLAISLFFFASIESGADFSLQDPAAPQTPELDIILEGGTVYTGSAQIGRIADVGIRGDRIELIGELSNRQAGLRINVRGLAVTPGFVDIHSRAVDDNREAGDMFLWPDAENYIRQGVTTVIGGRDGTSEYPVGILLDDLEDSPVAVNFGTFVGLNTVRTLAMGQENRPPTSIEMAEMKMMVAIAMKDGAFGLSSGIKYISDAFSETEEVIELARVAGEFGGIYITNMGEEGGTFVSSSNMPHPRNDGGFARVLEVYVRERGVLSFPEGINKLSKMPADRIQLRERGRIEPGAFADIAVLDLDEVLDLATIEQPDQFSIGVVHVFVNGQAVLLDNEMTGLRPGRSLRLKRER